MARLVIGTSSAQATQRLGQEIGYLAGPGDVLLLSGDLGAGKTQLVKGVAHGLGISEHVTSPTFNILLVHEGRLPLFHVDLYRLESARQLEDIDYFGTLESGGVVAVEWGDRFPDAAPPDYLDVCLHITGDNERRIELTSSGTRSDEIVHDVELAIRDLPSISVVGGAP